MTLYSPDDAALPTTVPSPPLARKISIACGPLHSRLNNGIMDSLPLALPPKAKDTRLYAAGLASFGMIYLTYEDLWHCVSHPPSLHDEQLNADSSHAKKIAHFFATLRPEGIERSTRLRNDLKYLDTRDESSTRAPSREGPAQARFRRHILRSLATKPHTLYAYAWCMYMAVFAGGRYIREDLANAGEKFWRHHGHEDSDSDSDSDSESASDGEDPDSDAPTSSTTTRAHAQAQQTQPLISPSSLTPRSDKKNKKNKKHHKPAPLSRPGYTFLSFTTPADQPPDDGASIRDAFIKNLYAAETLLTETEQEDVVAESQHIFELTIDLVAEMAARIRPDSSPPSSPPHASPTSRPTGAPAPPPSYTPYTLHSPRPHRPPAPPPYTTTTTTKAESESEALDPLLTLRASTPELLEWSRDPDPPRHGVVFWSKMALLVLASVAVGWGLLFGVRIWLWRLGGVGWDGEGEAEAEGHAGGWRWWSGCGR